MRIKIFILALFIRLNLWAQKEGFVIRGYIPGMPDGVKVTLMEKEGKRSTKAETIVKDERFELKGRVESPQAFMLITNNMEIQTKNPGMKIKWTYTDLFVENTEISITSGAYSELDSKSKLQVKGGQAHQDYEEFMNMKGSNREWDFIHSHPRSVVSVMLANGLLERGYNLTKEQVETLENNIIGCPCDTARYNEFKKRVALAKQTTVGAALLDLDLTDIDNRQVQLVDVVPKGKYVLIDFWASWCGMCIHSMPEVKKLAEEYSGQLEVIAVSCDKKQEAWRKAMERIKFPFPHYVMTEKGFNDFYYNKYQVRNGVPYYMLVAPDGTVLCAPHSVSQVRQILAEVLK